MEHEQRDEGTAEPRRPRVVDKRVSSRPPSESAPPREDAEPVEPARPAEPERPGAAEEAAHGPEFRPPPASPGPSGERVWTPEQEEEARRLMDEITRVPARDWVVSAAMNLVNVAAVKLDTGDRDGASLAIDALSGMLNTAGARLGEAEPSLRQVLAQLQMAFAQSGPKPPGASGG